MNQKQRVFIYDRKEIGVLTLLGVMVAAFAFTLGVHLGKKVGPNKTAHVAEAAPVATVTDKVPDAREISEQSKGVTEAADDTLRQSLQNEVTKVGVKTDHLVQVELPHKTKSKNAGATTLQHLKKLSAELEAEAVAPGKGGPYTLQIGSYPELSDAKSRVSAISKAGLKPFLREAEVKGRGHWYRVYLGEFASKTEAERAGQKFRTDHVIDSYIVAKIAPVTTE